MKGPVIIYAEQGAGKTRYAERLKKALGAERVVEEWDGRRPLAAGDLAFTNVELPDVTAIPLRDAVRGLLGEMA